MTKVTDLLKMSLNLKKPQETVKLSQEQAQARFKKAVEQEAGRNLAMQATKREGRQQNLQQVTRQQISGTDIFLQQRAAKKFQLGQNAAAKHDSENKQIVHQSGQQTVRFLSSQQSTIFSQMSLDKNSSQMRHAPLTNQLPQGHRGAVNTMTLLGTKSLSDQGPGRSLQHAIATCLETALPWLEQEMDHLGHNTQKTGHRESSAGRWHWVALADAHRSDKGKQHGLRSIGLYVSDYRNTTAIGDIRQQLPSLDHELALLGVCLELVVVNGERLRAGRQGR